MSFQSMAAEIRGCVPKLSYQYARTLVNRAWSTVRDRNLWSFQLWEGQWITPPQFSNVGTATCTQGSNAVLLDTVATAQLNATLATQPYSLLTQRQFRISVGGTLSGVYNIWGYNLADTGAFGAGGFGGGGFGTGGEVVTLLLDRPWGEASVANSEFTIYQVYYVAQRSAGAAVEYLPDFRSWISVRNIQLFVDLYTERFTKTQLSIVDPQRTTFQFPTDIVPYQTDQNPDSATYGYFLHEVWGAPLSAWTFMLAGIRRGLDLVAPTDTLPRAVGEDCVLAGARYYAYEWAEANRERGPGGRAYYSGPDFKFLMGGAQKQFDTLLKQYRREDREIVDNFFFVRRSALPSKTLAQYSTLAGTAYSGSGGGLGV